MMNTSALFNSSTNLIPNGNNPNSTDWTLPAGTAIDTEHNVDGNQSVCIPLNNSSNIVKTSMINVDLSKPYYFGFTIKSTNASTNTYGKIMIKT